MRNIKNAIIWLLAITLICYLMYIAESYENKQEKICTDKGMIIVRPYHDTPYCIYGTRDDL